MSRLFFTIGLLVLSIFLFSWISFPSNKNKTVKPPFALQGMIDTLKAELNYKNFCAGCHGEKMDMFVDRQWKHGTGADDLYKAIKVGYPDEGMPAFDSAFNDAEMKDLAEYMIKGIKNYKRYEFDAVKVVNYFPSESYNLRLDTMASGLHNPWSIAFLPGGKLLVTDRTGELYRIDKDRTRHQISGTPKSLSKGQGGLMDIVLHPNFKKNQLLYLSYAAFKDSSGVQVATTAIVRMKLLGNKLVEPKMIFEAWPYSRTNHHYGARMVFGKDGLLYFSVGERGNEKQNPQYLGNDLGKIHRIKDDGTVPADNPFVNTPGARPTIYAYGNRNPQGLTLNQITGEIWENEHGPRGGDEINLLKKGANYGWPIISYGINYDGRPITNKTAQQGIEQPLRYYIPSIGPSGITFVYGDRYKAWKGDILSGSLRFKYLDRTKMDGSKPSGEEMLLQNIGRVRDIRMSPDGYLYVCVEEPGYVFRLIPEEK